MSNTAKLGELLKWTIAQDPNPKFSKSNAKPMSASDREFLENAMKEVMIDEVDRVKEIIKILKSKDSRSQQQQPESDAKADESELVDKHEALLEELDDRVCQIDLAKDFHKVGGLVLLLELIESSPHERLRAMSAQVLGTIVQNNPYCQLAAYDNRAIELLMEVLRDMKETPLVKSKALYALSCLLRQFEQGEEAFLTRLKGVDLLNNLIVSESAKVKGKAISLLRHFWWESADARRNSVDAGILPVLVKLIGYPDDLLVRESALGALSDLAERSKDDITEKLRAKSLGLQDRLMSRIQEIGALEDESERERYSDELDQSIELVQRLFPM